MRTFIIGMHGLGDTIHERGVVRQIEGDVWIETSWPSVWHDMPNVRPVRRRIALRTQTKNANREARLFHSPPRDYDRRIQIWYPPELVRRCGSVLGAMCSSAGVSPDNADFRMPVPDEWVAKARAVVGNPEKPILVYRPLVERKEWGGCHARNPDTNAYADLLADIRDRYHLVSLADLDPSAEWQVGHPVAADTTLHAGELDFQGVAGLFSIASLVWASPGFAVVLSQAVGTPVIAIFGGYESSWSFGLGARYSPYLGIDPVNPCACFSHNHTCDKRIDMARARERIAGFLS